MDSIIVWAAIGLELGLSPVLPGVVGALPGALIALFTTRLRLEAQIILVIVLAALAVPLCGKAAAELGTGDDRRIVADEYMTFPIPTVGLPCARYPALLVPIFTASTVRDGVKPPPARQAERLTGGVGMVLDDVAANLYALIIGMLVYAWFFRQRH